ncbi:MAG: cation diffusion facilitator family transporter [Spirochaeta sp.]|jgi:cation diffusion facilitator family transporter|nr:cation diffusion facilitator family transporter [Spirochaeta sp.]
MKDNVIVVTIIGAFSNVALAVVKVLFGLVGNSAALIADGVHSVSDLVTDAVVLFGVKIARKPPDDNHTYGHGRYETISAFLVGLILVSAGGVIGWHGLRQAIGILDGAVVAPPQLFTLAIAAVSVVVKEILFQLTRTAGRAQNSPVVVANAWHHRSDALSSVATLIGISGAIFLGERWVILDPITAVLVSVLVVVVGLKTAIHALREMTDHALSENECAEVLSIVDAVSGVTDPHNLKTRRLGPTVAVEIHVRVDGEMTVNEAHARASEVERRIRDRFGADTTVITHVEPTFTDAAARR